MTDEFYLSEKWKRRIEEAGLGREIGDPACRRAWIARERHNLAHDINSAWDRGSCSEVHGLRYYAWRPWQELIAPDRAVAQN